MGNDLLECLKRERTGKPLDEFLKHDEEYQKSKRRYHDTLEKVRKCINKDTSQDSSIILELDEAVGDYSASYGDAAYSLGFQDGMEVDLESRKDTGREQELMEIILQDMIDLIQVHDAYKELNTNLHGQFTAYAFDEGLLGKMGRIYEVINRHLSLKYQKDDACDRENILADISMEPEERAKLLMNGE